MSVDRFIAMEKAHYSISLLCRVLQVARSGYYAWRRRGPSARALADAALTTTMTQIHVANRGVYGAPRVHVELRDAQQVRCGKKRHPHAGTRRLMRQAGLVGVCRRRTVRTTRRAEPAVVATDLVGRRFTAAAPDRLWVADLTFLPTGQGFLYLAVVLDVFSRRVVGWALAPHLRTEVVLAALEMALTRRRPAAGLIHHSDHGSQYTSFAFGARCQQAGIVSSLGSVGDCSENALMESFFATVECELVAREHWRTHAQARSAVFAYIETFYNPRRRHSSLGYLSPAAFERRAQH